MTTISFFRLYPHRRICSLFPPDHHAREPVETLIVTSGLPTAWTGEAVGSRWPSGDPIGSSTYAIANDISLL